MREILFGAGGLVLGFILSYAFHGTWKLIIKKAKGQLLGDLADVRARLDVLYEKAEGEFKAEIGKIRDLLKVKL